MKYKKAKGFAAVLVAAALCMSGCGSKNEPVSAPEETEAGQQTESEETKEKAAEEKPAEESEPQTTEEEASEESKDKKEEEKTAEKETASQEKPAVEEEKKPEEKQEEKKEEKKVEPQVSEKKEEPPAPTPAAPASKYKDGNYTGSAAGYNGDVTVSLTVKGDKITALSVVSHSDDDLYMEDAKGVVSKILSAQSADVDSVSGATFSSEGIKNAVKAALQQAKN